MLRHTLGEWRDRCTWILLFLSLVVLLCVYRVTLPSPLFINVGAEGDERYLFNFHSAEQGGAYPFRWTQESSYVKVPNMGSLPLEIILGADAARPEGQPLPRVSLIANRMVLADFTMPNGIRAHRFLYHPPLLPLPKNLLLEIKSEAFSPPGDEYRALGILVNTVEIKPIISSLHLILIPLMGALSIVLGYLLLCWLGMSGKKSLVCGIAALALLGLDIVGRFIIVRFLAGVLGFLLVGYVLAILLEARGYREPLVTRLSRKALEDWAENLVSVMCNLYLCVEIKRKLYPLSQKEYFLSVVAVSVLFLAWLPFAFIGPSATIAGERYWWLSDDAMISMRYARNLASGVGLVWNPGERVEGYSNFLWTIYMALVHCFPVPASKTALVVILTNIALAAITIPVLIQLVRTLSGGTLATIATLGGYVLNQGIMGWAIAGFETPLLTFLLVLAMYRVLHESKLNQPRLDTYFLIAAVSLVRADAIVLSALLYALALWLNKVKRVVFIYSLISILLPTGHEVFRICYYGDILPNTAYLKVMNWSGRYVSGLEYVLDFAKHYAFPIAFAILGSVFSRDLPRRSLLGAFVLYTAYVVYIGGDAAFQYFRFFVPVLPLLMALAFLGIQSLASRQIPRLTLSILCLVTMPLITRHYATVFSPKQGHGFGNVRIGLMLKRNTPATSKVADFWAGSVFYFSERYGIDLLGKSDRHVAHLPIVSNEGHPGHNKFDFDYSLGVLKPDFVVANFKLPVDENEMRKNATGDWAFTGQLYFNPVFREHCMPNPVAAETWRTIFVCDWSSQLEKKDEWVELP